MSDATKACNLTEEEVMSLLIRTGDKFGWPNANFEELVDRIKYFSSRLKAFREVEIIKNEPKPEPAPAGMPAAPSTWGASA